MRYASLAGFLFVFWLALSGHYTPMLITAGAHHGHGGRDRQARMQDDLGDGPSRLEDLVNQPGNVGDGALEKLDRMTFGIGGPHTNGHPRAQHGAERAGQKTNAGIATYANSITLTPGTITVGVSGNDLTIHALAREGALDLEGGGMDRRVSQFEGAA